MFAWFDAWLDRIADFVEGNKQLLLMTLLVMALGKVLKLRVNIGGAK